MLGKKQEKLEEEIKREIYKEQEQVFVKGYYEKGEIEK